MDRLRPGIRSRDCKPPRRRRTHRYHRLHHRGCKRKPRSRCTCPSCRQYRLRNLLPLSTPRTRSFPNRRAGADHRDLPIRSPRRTRRRRCHLSTSRRSRCPRCSRFRDTPSSRRSSTGPCRFRCSSRSGFPLSFRCWLTSTSHPRRMLLRFGFCRQSPTTVLPCSPRWELQCLPGCRPYPFSAEIRRIPASSLFRLCRGGWV